MNQRMIFLIELIKEEAENLGIKDTDRLMKLLDELASVIETTPEVFKQLDNAFLKGIWSIHDTQQEIGYVKSDIASAQKAITSLQINNQTQSSQIEYLMNEFYQIKYDPGYHN